MGMGLLSPGCCNCGGGTVTRTYAIGGNGPCVNGVVVYNSGATIFGGSLQASVGGTNTPSTTASCTTGPATYSVGLSSTNANCTVSPGTVTVNANSGCFFSGQSPSAGFTVRYTYWDSPNTPGQRVGSPLGAICGCISTYCNPFPAAVSIAPSNQTGNQATYQKKTGGDCDNPVTSPPVFTATPYNTNTYNAQTLTFQAIPSSLSGFPSSGAYSFQLGGQAIIPSYGYYSDSFVCVHTPDDHCGYTCDTSLRNPDENNNSGPPHQYTDWYLMTCGSSSLDLYLIEKEISYSYACNNSLAPTWTPVTNWYVTRIWTWADGASTCSPLHVATGYITAGTAPGFDMVMTA